MVDNKNKDKITKNLSKLNNLSNLFKIFSYFTYFYAKNKFMNQIIRKFNLNNYHISENFIKVKFIKQINDLFYLF